VIVLLLRLFGSELLLDQDFLHRVPIQGVELLLYPLLRLFDSELLLYPLYYQVSPMYEAMYEGFLLLELVMD